MAIGINQPFLPPLPQGPAPLTRAPEPGSLIIVDQFVPSGPFDANIPHGQVVHRAAQHQGFRGPVVERPMPNAFQQTAGMAPGNLLASPNLSAQDTRAAIDSFAGQQQTALLVDASSELQALRQAGTHHTAVNMSYGTSQAKVVQRLYDMARPAWEPGENSLLASGAHHTLQNYARAFDLDESRLHSPDPKLSGPERARLQQALVDRVGAASRTDPMLGSARELFAGEVRAFEANHNSVVVSAGNDGETLKNLRAQAGKAPRVAPDFEKNVLSSGEATTVGATRFFQRGGELSEQRANYSSRDPATTIYASGSTALDPSQPQQASAWGTSFASPRVAATMATLHQTHPDMSSAQVERLMRDRLTHQLEDQGQSVPVLDQQRASRYLQEHRF